MCSYFEKPDFLLVVTFLFLYIWLRKSIQFSLYSRWWGGWAVGEAGTAGWTPQRSASSPSTASWTDPSWLRPLASWVTRGSGSDRQQLSRTGCESPGGGGESLKPPPAVGRRRREAVSWERAQFSLGCALLRTDRGRWADLCASPWGECLNFPFQVWTQPPPCLTLVPCTSPGVPPFPPPLRVWCCVQRQVRLQALLSAWIGMLIDQDFGPPSLAVCRPIRDK